MRGQGSAGLIGEMFGQLHRRWPEEAVVHGPEVTADVRPETHPADDVALDVDSGRDLDQFDAFSAEPEYRAFGDVEHPLVALAAVGAAVSDLLHLFHQFCMRAVAGDLHLAVWPGELGFAGGKGAAENDTLGVLAYVDE